MKASPPAAMMGLAMPLLDGLLIHPDGQRTTLHQGLVVLFPVADLVLGLAHLALPVVNLRDQITVSAAKSAYLPSLYCTTFFCNGLQRDVPG